MSVFNDMHWGFPVDLYSNNHSVFNLNYHLILVIKYRRRVLDDEISERARQMFTAIAPAYNIHLDTWNHDVDHVHVLFQAEPNSELSKFINAYKSASSRVLKKEFPRIKRMLWKEHFWSRSFCLISTGGAPIEIIRGYIEDQGEPV